LKRASGGEEAVNRLAELLAEPDPGLDRVLAVIGLAVDHDAPSERDIVAKLDELAAGCRGSGNGTGTGTGSVDVDEVFDHIFARCGFAADTADYYSPDNSLIHRVLDRRRGIPLSLAALAAEVGRRVGIDLRPVGLPGHVLLGVGPEPSIWFDPFAGGTRLTADDCKLLFSRFHPPAAFQPSMLAPIGAAAVALRTLNNLRGAYLRRGQPVKTIPVLELVLALPGAGPSNLAELAELLENVGRNDQAADAFERLAELDPAGEERHRHRVRALRAHRN
jgi:regulator of sirC expression with transglutaminase-like and TPR domain